MAIEPGLREQIKTIRMRLLDLHKLLLDRERGIYESAHGNIGSPGEYLQLVLEHEQFAWLRRLSGVIVEMDELIRLRTTSGAPEAEATLESARQILRLQEHGTDYQQRYWAAIQDSPDVVIAHCQTERALGILAQ